MIAPIRNGIVQDFCSIPFKERNTNSSKQKNKKEGRKQKLSYHGVFYNSEPSSIPLGALGVRWRWSRPHHLPFKWLSKWEPSKFFFYIYKFFSAHGFFIFEVPLKSHKKHTPLERTQVSHEQTVHKWGLHRWSIRCCPPDSGAFKGHLRLAGLGCWDVVRLRGLTVQPGSQLRKLSLFENPLLLSAGDKGTFIMH